MNSTNKQASKIYFLIYEDRKNKDNGMIQPTKSQEIIRDNLELKNGWNEYESGFQLVEKISNKLTPQQASYVIDLLLHRKYKIAEEILTK
jgi:hypothetical protein